jgi:hypothetical protein
MPFPRRLIAGVRSGTKNFPLSKRMKLDEAYEDHKVFRQLSDYSDFYKSLSFSVFGFVTLGTKAVCNIDSYVYSSVHGTLESIKHALLNRRISDAYALLRRYYDSAIINVYSNLYLKNNLTIANFVVDQIQNWLEGKNRLPEYRVMSNYIRASAELAKLNTLLYADTTYKEIRDRCNDFTHYNFYRNVLFNDNEVFLNRTRTLEGFSKDLDNIMIFHLSYLFSLNEHYMMSSDYVDSLECGSTPPKDSQYFVAPFVQEIFDSVIKKNRMDIATELMNSTDMKLE